MDIVMLVLVLFLIITLIFILVENIQYFIDRKNSKRKLKHKLKLEKLLKKPGINKTLIKKLKNVDYLLLFEELYIEDNHIISLEDNMDIFVELSKYYIKQAKIKQTYFAYLLSYLKESHPALNNYLNEVLSTKDIVSIDQILLTTLKHGYYNNFLEKLDRINSDKIDYNAKLLSDHMMEYSWNK